MTLGAKIRACDILVAFTPPPKKKNAEKKLGRDADASPSSAIPKGEDDRYSAGAGVGGVRDLTGACALGR